MNQCPWSLAVIRLRISVGRVHTIAESTLLPFSMSTGPVLFVPGLILLPCQSRWPKVDLDLEALIPVHNKRELNKVTFVKAKFAPDGAANV